jgi:membrane-associated phospholipid phosphatase
MVLHIVVHGVVNAANASRDAASLIDLSMTPDEWIPYLGWTWVFYYTAHFYTMGAGPIILLKLEERGFRRAIYVFVLMIVAGGLIQLVLPARSPWPEDGSAVQNWFHTSVTWDPYVCLPSMHVALVLLLGLISFRVIRSLWLRRLTIVAISLISLSTLTLKEHYILDVLAGGVLGFLAYLLWRSGTRTISVQESDLGGRVAHHGI